MPKKLQQWLTKNGPAALAQLRRALAAQAYSLSSPTTEKCLRAMDYIANHLPTLRKRKSAIPTPIAARADLDCLHHLRTAAGILSQHNINTALANL